VIDKKPETSETSETSDAMAVLLAVPRTPTVYMFLDQPGNLSNQVFFVSYAWNLGVSPTLLWMTAKSKENHLGWFFNILKQKNMGRLPLTGAGFHIHIFFKQEIPSGYSMKLWIIPIFERYIIINLESRKLVNQQPPKR